MLKKNHILLLTILAVSIGLRIAYLYQISSTPLFGFYTVDSQYHDKFALKILEGNLTFKETIYISPLYSFFLAAIYKLFGHSLMAAALLQVIIDTITGVFLYIICAKAFGKKSIGLAAFFIYSCYAISIFYTAFILEATLSAFFMTGFIMAILYADSDNKKILWILSGIIFGLLLLVRANAMLLAPFLIFWTYSRRGKKAAKATLCLGLIFIGVFISVLPFSVRNHLITNNVSPFPVNGGLNFYIGNNPDATGIYRPLEGISNSPVNQIKQSILKAKMGMGREISPLQASSFWFLKGLRFIRNNPWQYIVLELKKIYLFWNRTEAVGNEDFYFCKSYIPLLRFPLFSFGFVAPFAILGFLFAAKQREAGLSLIALCVLGYMLSVITFYVEARYRFPVVPLIIIMASYAINQLFHLPKDRRTRELLLYLPILAISFLIVNARVAIADPALNLHINYNNLGVSYYEKGDVKNAAAEFEKALEANPRYSEAYNNLAAVYCRMGRLNESMRLYHKAIELNPNFREPWHGLAIVYTMLGDDDKAAEMYKKAQE